MLHHPWQFSLKYLFALVLAFCLFFAAIQAEGLTGALGVLFSTGILLLAYGWARRSSLCISLGAQLVLYMGLLL